MKVNVEELSPILKKVSVELPAEEVDRALDRAFRAVGKKARIKGFRPGKVPRRLLEQHYGHQVRHEVADTLIQESWPKAVEQESVDVVAPPELDEEEHLPHVEPGQPWAYTVKVEVMPQVQVTKYEGLEGTTLKVEVKDEEVDAEVERLRESMAQLVPVEGREEAAEGDYLVVDVEAKDGDEKIEAASGEGYTFEVAEGEVIQAKLAAAAGHKVGDVVEATQSFPEDHSAEPLRGKDVSFHVTIKEIKERKLPAVDDELAKDVGEEGVENLLQLRGWIRERIAASRKQEADRKLKDSLLQALVEANPITVPPALIERTAQNMVSPVLEQMLRAGLDPNMIGREEIQRMVQEVRPRAETVVKGSLLLQALADKEDIQVGDEQVEAHYQELAQQSGQPVEKVKAAFNKDPAEMESLMRRLREDAALAFVKGRASITEEEPGKAETGEEVEGSEAPPAAE